MEKSKIGGGLLAAVGIAAPWVANMMGLTVPAPVGWVLLALCGVAFIAGLTMIFWPSKREQDVSKEGDQDKPKEPQGTIGFYFKDCIGSVVEGNVAEGFDTPFVNIGGRNNRFRRNVARRGRKPEGSES